MLNMDTMVATLEQGMAEITKQHEKLAVELRQSLAGAFTEIFEAFPDLESFGWLQYTPYFNDGEACTFHVHSELHAVYAGYEIDWIGQWSPEGEGDISLPLPVGEALKPLMTMLGAGNDIFFLHAFGDHMKVIVTREGITTEEYSHD